MWLLLTCSHHLPHFDCVVWPSPPAFLCSCLPPWAPACFPGLLPASVFGSCLPSCLLDCLSAAVASWACPKAQRLWSALSLWLLPAFLPPRLPLCCRRRLRLPKGSTHSHHRPTASASNRPPRMHLIAAQNAFNRRPQMHLIAATNVFNPREKCIIRRQNTYLIADSQAPHRHCLCGVC